MKANREVTILVFAKSRARGDQNPKTRVRKYFKSTEVALIATLRCRIQFI